jgi:hypothetical protein
MHLDIHDSESVDSDNKRLFRFLLLDNIIFCFLFSTSKIVNLANRVP